MSEEETVGGNGQTAEEPKFVSKEDRLEAENLHLKILSLAQQEQLLNQKVATLQKERAEFHNQLVSMRNSLADKYDINMETHEIRNVDGAVIERGSTPDFSQLMKSVGA
jgi:hypothetical protein